jgi:hypothetical protein
LEDTESRLTRLESMLSELDSAALDSVVAVHPLAAHQAEPAFEAFTDEVADDEQLFLDEQAVLPEIGDDGVQEFPADDFDEDQRLIA